MEPKKRVAPFNIDKDENDECESLIDGENGNGNGNGNQSMMNRTNATTADPQKDMLVRVIISLIFCFGTYILTQPNKNKTANQFQLQQQFQQLHQQQHSLLHSSNKIVAFWNGPDLFNEHQQKQQQKQSTLSTSTNDEFRPAIAWLASYPNSGTSFTMTTVEHMSNLSTASNYGDEVTALHTEQPLASLSIYPRHIMGPYWDGMSGRKGSIRKLPTNYVLTKTHCGSRCVHCPPSQYIETYQSFLDACRNTSARLFFPTYHKQTFLYPFQRVHKLIHLIRNPLHNFVARFHLDRKTRASRASKTNKKEQLWLDSHPSNETGFQIWCHDLDEEYKNEEYKSFDAQFLQILQSTPCHGEVYRFVQWHNMVFQMADERKKILQQAQNENNNNNNNNNNPIPPPFDVMVLHYEDYEKDFSKTMHHLLDFLEQPAQAEPREFSPGHEYNTYYSKKDKQHIQTMIQQMASPTTWDALKHYF